MICIVEIVLPKNNGKCTFNLYNFTLVSFLIIKYYLIFSSLRKHYCDKFLLLICSATSNLMDFGNTFLIFDSYQILFLFLLFIFYFQV